MNEFTTELMHMSPAAKKLYNKNYYQTHKNLWSEYYSKGLKLGRQAPPATLSDPQPKTITEDIITEDMITEQVDQMNNYISSQEFKTQMKKGIQVFKKVAPELIKTSMKLLNEYKNDFIDLGKSLIKSLFKR